MSCQKRFKWKHDTSSKQKLFRIRKEMTSCIWRGTAEYWDQICLSLSAQRLPILLGCLIIPSSTISVCFPHSSQCYTTRQDGIAPFHDNVSCSFHGFPRSIWFLMPFQVQTRLLTTAVVSNEFISKQLQWRIGITCFPARPGGMILQPKSWSDTVFGQLSYDVLGSDSVTKRPEAECTTNNEVETWRPSIYDMQKVEKTARQ